MFSVKLLTIIFNFQSIINAITVISVITVTSNYSTIYTLPYTHNSLLNIFQSITYKLGRCFLLRSVSAKDAIHILLSPQFAHLVALLFIQVAHACNVHYTPRILKDCWTTRSRQPLYFHLCLPPRELYVYYTLTSLN